ncbi:flagellar filament capping protein FliD [Desulfovibrio sp. JC010]|uniref:flagellar filament capping protein FliD n=1 Tax=Desulfovibrio sp. JC010 TaxID=2593641 RepID=UPI0013D0ED6F|nr:flagellar filament capping protein FliD [Desulfovibrio sp. JC010]NDV28346.1 flagellar hook protein [Desulfovibrio sp. JC010]
MSDYTSGNINFTGLGSGTDFQQLIDGLIKLERTHINRLESWKSSWSDKVEKFQELNTALLGLQTTLKSMDTLDEFMTKTVSSTNSDIATATASAEADVTAHSLEVHQLAKNDIIVGLGGTAEASDVYFSAAGSFTFYYDGDKITLSNIPAGTTMQGFVNMINNHADSRDKIRAATLDDGGVVHLQIYGLDLGASHQIVLSSIHGSIFDETTYYRSQDAQNAQIKVDGYPYLPNYWIERESNTIDDVIPGVTLNLKQAMASGASMNIGVTTDKDGMVENVQKFVDQVNTVRQMIKDLTDVTTSSDSAKGSILTGNYGVELLVGQRLKEVVANKGIGFSWFYEDPSTGNTSGDRYSSLAQLGIKTNADSGGANMGLLELDTEELTKALNDDPMAVAKLFSANYLGESDSPNLTYLSHINGTTKAGEYNVRYEVSGGVLTKAWINGEPASVDSTTWQITGASGSSASGMAIRVENKTDGVYGSSNTDDPNAMHINLKLGKIGEMVEILGEITSQDGPLEILQDNYDTIMKNIDKKIESEEDRIDLKKQMLTEKYARLDALLGNYQGIQAQLASSINGLNSN